MQNGSNLTGLCYGLFGDKSPLLKREMREDGRLQN
jgi:hypothetical protein